MRCRSSPQDGPTPRLLDVSARRIEQIVQVPMAEYMLTVLRADSSASESYMWRSASLYSSAQNAAVHVPDDGGRQPGSCVLRLVRGVRGPLDQRHVPNRRTRRAGPQGWVGARLFQER